MKGLGALLEVLRFNSKSHHRGLVAITEALDMVIEVDKLAQHNIEVLLLGVHLEYPHMRAALSRILWSTSPMASACCSTPASSSSTR